jgi:hypothetical protein
MTLCHHVIANSDIFMTVEKVQNLNTILSRFFNEDLHGIKSCTLVTHHIDTKLVQELVRIC